MEGTTGLLWFGALQLSMFWMYLILIAIVAAELGSIKSESLPASSLILLVFLVFLHVGGFVDIASLVWNHPWHFGAGVLLYLIIGSLWSVTKYKIFVRVEGETIEKMDITRERKDDRLTNLEFENHIDDLAMWLIAWPFSFLLSFLEVAYELSKSFIRDVLGAWLRSIFRREVDKLKARRRPTEN